MMFSPGIRVFRAMMAAALTALAVTSPAAAEVRPAGVFGSHMVLQAESEVPVWGWADAQEEVTVRIAGQEVRTRAGGDGRWMVKLAPMPAGGPHRLEIVAGDTLALEDVLIGEVWLCSGQSNMEWGIKVSADPEKEIAAADHPRIRLLSVPHRTARRPEPDIDARWAVCTPEGILSVGHWNAGFSAVAYHFGRRLQEELDVPVGLIQSTWGGTRIEPWTPPEGFQAVPALAGLLEPLKRADEEFREAVGRALTAHQQWLEEARARYDAGKEAAPPPAWPRHPLDDNSCPTSLYNGMIHPLVPCAIRGAIWYQGESNRTDGMGYVEKKRALIGGWRQLWGRGDFPFYFVQLAPYRYGTEDPTILPRMWEAQTRCLEIPNTGMAVTVDIGDPADIHPRNKRDVGERLALWALARTYGRKDLVFSGPLYRSASNEGGAIRIRFDHVGGGLISRDGGPLSWFEIAGTDRHFVPAEALIDGDTVVVRANEVADPAAVRFSWHMEARPNLCNREGLPASPFRTDSW